MADLEPGPWQRAGRSRALVLKLGRKAQWGDAFIAQTVIDHGLCLITPIAISRRFLWLQSWISAFLLVARGN